MQILLQLVKNNAPDIKNKRRILLRTTVLLIQVGNWHGRIHKVI